MVIVGGWSTFCPDNNNSQRSRTTRNAQKKEKIRRQHTENKRVPELASLTRLERTQTRRRTSLSRYQRDGYSYKTLDALVDCKVCTAKNENRVQFELKSHIFVCLRLAPLGWHTHTRIQRRQIIKWNGTPTRNEMKMCTLWDLMRIIGASYGFVFLFSIPLWPCGMSDVHIIFNFPVVWWAWAPTTPGRNENENDSPF